VFRGTVLDDENEIMSIMFPKLSFSLSFHVVEGFVIYIKQG